MESPRPAEGTHLFMLGDEAVLYSHQSQELYSFNTAAALIWCSLDLGNTLAETTSVLARALRSSPDQALTHIETCLAQWAVLGVLAGSERPTLEHRPLMREIALPGSQPDLPPVRETPSMIERSYRLLATR